MVSQNLLKKVSVNENISYRVIKKDDAYNHDKEQRIDPIVVTTHSDDTTDYKKWNSRKRDQTKNKSVSIKPYSGATSEDIYDFIKPEVRKCPETVVIHVGF